MTDKEKLKILVSNSLDKLQSSRMTESFIAKSSQSMVSYVKESTKFYSDSEINFTKRIMLVLGDQHARLKCVCGNDISPMSRGESAGLFRQFCSQVCSGSANKGRKITRTEEHQALINLKRSETMVELHGHAYNSQRPEVKLMLIAAKHTTHPHIRYDLLNDRDFLVEQYKTYPTTDIGEMCNCDYSVVIDYLNKYGIEIGGDHTKMSREQRKLGDFIESLGFEVVMNAKVLGNHDIDIFIPSLRIGIEYNGFPFHLENFSGGRKGSYYHHNKTEKALAQGIRLVHVFPHDVHKNEGIVQSIVKNALGVTRNKIAARKCVVSEVSKLDAKNFLIENHLKGNSTFDVAVGLYFESELVHVVTFGPSRFDKKYQHEIIRSASKMNTSVVGGFSKCLAYFVKGHCVTGEKIMTYADRSISEGNSYVLAGFKFVRSTLPGYHYTERKSGGFVVHSRYKFQKHKLMEFPNYSIDKTEWEIMVEAGYDRFWDSGNNMFEYVVQK